MMTGALVERRSPGRRVTHDNMGRVRAVQESKLVEHPRIALGHGDPLPFPVHRHLTCSLHLGVAPGAARESSRPMLDDQPFKPFKPPVLALPQPLVLPLLGRPIQLTGLRAQCALRDAELFGQGTPRHPPLPLAP